MNELDQVKDYLQSLQSRIIAELEQLDGKQKFRRDAWTRPGGGGGLSCILSDGDVFEQAGVGFSHVFGDTLPPSASKTRPELAGKGFQAVGVSLVIHPRNPYVPTTHANFRYFRAADADNDAPVWWFGGGFDLTPYYAFAEDVRHWHSTAKQACDPFGDDLYARYKQWCDEYFYLKHRDETRGVGGLFFDDLNDKGFDASFAFLRSVGDSFMPAYRPIVKKRKDSSLRRATARVPAVPARPLRRVQPDLRSWHDFRAAVRRSHRVDPDVVAAARALGVQLAAGGGLGRRKAVHGLPAGRATGWLPLLASEPAASSMLRCPG